MISPQGKNFFHVASAAGQKRSAPALLPAFQPTSPKLPRTSTIKRRNASQSPKTNPARIPQNHLPSAPSSSTFVPSSSPPASTTTHRPGLQRTVSTLSERTPLAALTSIELDRHGQETLLGRSSSSSHHQLSTNKLISRIHVRASYFAATSSNPRQIQIKCIGWNGVKVHCLGRVWDLFKGDTFTSETEDAEIMVDVHDARVLLKWPSTDPKILTPSDSEHSWESEASPAGRRNSRHQAAARQSQPHDRPYSPDSARPTRLASIPLIPYQQSPPQRDLYKCVQIYEDGSSDEDKQAEGTFIMRSCVSGSGLSGDAKTSFEADSLRESDEENDPIVHSFGPYGANLNNRFGAISANLSPGDRQPLRVMNPARKAETSPQQTLRSEHPPKRTLSREASEALRSPTSSSSAEHHKTDDIASFAINHLMYSPLSATPLSTILGQVIAHLATGRNSADSSLAIAEVSSDTLKSLLESIPCIGSVRREGKDAAGKALESEYYYISEFDEDPARRSAVQSLGIGARGLRSCRKSHKARYDTSRQARPFLTY